MKDLYESRILLVDDQPELCRMVMEILKKAGYKNTRCVYNLKEARNILNNALPDLWLLDVNLPDGDGFTFLQELRAVSGCPVLFLSARDQDADRLLGLGLGADDYITKPFLPRELVLRVANVLKRTYQPFVQKDKQTKIHLGEKTVDFAGGTVEQAGKETALTAKELLILQKLADNRGNIVTFDALCETLWGDNYYGYENTLMVHIRRLREKIEENPSSPRYLLTVRGLGYKLAK